ncbi:MAG: hypothetical protein WC378_14030 [Opitutaceae bacterium]|jgi:hypothetical protein
MQSTARAKYPHERYDALARTMLIGRSITAVNLSPGCARQKGRRQIQTA